MHNGWRLHNTICVMHIVLQINSIEVEVEETNKPKIRNTHEITLKIRIEFIDQSLLYCTKTTITLFLLHATNINEASIRYWYFMLHSLTNVKISNKDFNWKKKKRKKKWNKTLTLREHMNSSQFVLVVSVLLICLLVCVVHLLSCLCFSSV